VHSGGWSTDRLSVKPFDLEMPLIVRASSFVDRHIDIGPGSIGGVDQAIARFYPGQPDQFL
jgi:hypothetical protein